MLGGGRPVEKNTKQGNGDQDCQCRTEVLNGIVWASVIDLNI